MNAQDGVGRGESMVLRAVVFTGTSALALPLFSLPSPLKGDLAMEVHQSGPKWRTSNLMSVLAYGPSKGTPRQGFRFGESKCRKNHCERVENTG